MGHRDRWGCSHRLNAKGAAFLQILLNARVLVEGAGAPRSVKDDRVRDLDLAHGEFPPIPGRAIVAAQRGRNHAQPALEEGLDLLGTERIAELLESRGIAARSEAVGELAERGARFGRLTLGPLVTVDPDLAEVGECRRRA